MKGKTIVTERSSIGCVRGRRLTTRAHQGTFGLIVSFYIFIVVVATQPYTFIKIYHTVFLK